MKVEGRRRKLEKKVYQKGKDNENKEEGGEKSKNMISSKEQETRVDSKKRRKNK